MNDYIVTEVSYNGSRFLAAASYEERRLTEIRLEKADDASIVGNVYRGLVEDVAKNIKGAFVRIGEKRKAFLPLGEHENVHASTPILVQVTKDAAGIKEAVLTTNIHITSESCVLSKNPGRTSYSQKLTQEEKSLIKKWLRETDMPQHHVLIRTNALRSGKQKLIDEIKSSEERMQKVLADYEHAVTGELLYKPEPFYYAALRDSYIMPDRCFSDIPSCAADLEAFSEEIRQPDGSVRHFQYEHVFYAQRSNSLSLAQLYDLERDLEKLSQKRVWLKNGAFLVIEQTEAFVSVDVNSGRCVKGKIAEETYRKINLEAAAELSRQLRLRNLSGMILVDFIKLSNEEHKEELINVMKKLVRKDHIHTEVVDLTGLGILEIIRQKVRKPLAETIGLC